MEQDMAQSGCLGHMSAWKMEEEKQWKTLPETGISQSNLVFAQKPGKCILHTETCKKKTLRMWFYLKTYQGPASHPHGEE